MFNNIIHIFKVHKEKLIFNYSINFNYKIIYIILIFSRKILKKKKKSMSLSEFNYTNYLLLLFIGT